MPSNHTSRKVAEIIGLYLPLTQTFIYEYLSNFRQFEPEVFAQEVENLDKFPLDTINLLPKRATTKKAIDKVSERLLGYKPIHDSSYIRLLKQKHIGLIHAHFGWYAPSMITIKENLGIPLVTTFYGRDMSVLPNEEYYKISYQKLFQAGDLFLVEGGHMKSELVKIGCPAEKIRIQHIGIDPKKFNFKARARKNRGEPIKILMCNSFVEKKGTSVGITAFARSLDHFKKMELHIIGDGLLREQIDALVKELRIEDKVTLCGYRSHEFYRRELEEAHIFMAPSYTGSDGDSEGGAPTVLLEAQASGLPVLSTFHADIPEVVIDNSSGFLVPEQDAEALAEKLNLLIDQPELWGKMGEVGRAYIEKNYNIYNEANKLENIYAELYKTN